MTSNVVCIGNRMISSAIWNKKARVNLIFEKIYKCLFIPNCTRKSCDYLLIIAMKKKKAHFRVAACLSFKASPGAQPFKWK